MNVNRGFSSVPVQKKPSVQAMLNEYVDKGGWRKRFDELLGKRSAQYISSLVTLVNSDDKLMSVFYEKPMQVIQCALKAATYDLPLEKAFGFAYIIPFGRDAVFVLGCKGIIQLALRTGQYVRINAIEVREGELKSRNLLTEDFVFDWCEDPVERAKRPVVGYIAYYRLKNGMEKYFYMSKAEMQQHEKENRKGKFMSPTWKDRFDDMGKKTVLRLLLSKWGILSIDYQHADQSVQHFQENLANGTLDDEDTLKSRRFPYAYTISPDRVEDYSMDKNGRLLRITFTDISGQSSDAGDHRRTVTFTENNWSVTEDGKPAGNGEHGLGAVPVIFFPSQDTDAGDIHPSPELYPQARAAIAIYNHCSWLTEILRNQTFPILTFPSTQAKDLTLGTNNALCFDGEVSKFQPGFIAPPSDPAQLIQSQIELLIREMYRMASLSFISDTKDQTSGIARQWEFERTNQRLSEFAARCAKAEKRMAEMAALWMHMDLTYTVSYSQDFGITDTETDMKNAQALMDLGLSPEMKIEAARRVLASYAPDMPAGRYDEIMADVERQAREPSYNEPPAPTGDD